MLPSSSCRALSFYGFEHRALKSPLSPGGGGKINPPVPSLNLQPSQPNPSLAALARSTAPLRRPGSCHAIRCAHSPPRSVAPTLRFLLSRKRLRRFNQCPSSRWSSTLTRQPEPQPRPPADAAVFPPCVPPRLSPSALAPFASPPASALSLSTLLAISRQQAANTGFANRFVRHLATCYAGTWHRLPLAPPTLQSNATLHYSRESVTDCSLNPQSTSTQRRHRIGRFSARARLNR